MVYVAGISFAVAKLVNIVESSTWVDSIKVRTFSDSLIIRSDFLKLL